MQSFGWKRKAGLTKPKPAVFSQDNVEVDNDMNDPDVDWLTATKKPKVRTKVSLKPRHFGEECE